MSLLGGVVGIVRGMNYMELLTESWKDLKKWIRDGKFNPKSEDDVKCLLYHFLVERQGSAKDIYTEFPYGDEHWADLAVGDEIIVEIKPILFKTDLRDTKSWEARKKRVKGDIKKLRALRDRQGCLIVFARSYKEEDEFWYEDVEKLCKASGIRLLRFP